MADTLALCQRWCSVPLRPSSKLCWSAAVARAQTGSTRYGRVSTTWFPAAASSTREAQLLAVLRAPAGAAGLTVTGQFNLGEGEDDFRVPDGGLHRPGAGGTWQPTAALVIEIVSPDDQSWQKLPFYAKHNVDEVLIVDPAERTVTWLALGEGEHRPVQRSGLIELGSTELAEQIDWPSTQIIGAPAGRG
jgi:Putative restriction endonuclease